MQQNFVTSPEDRLRNRIAGKRFRDRKKLSPEQRRKDKIESRFFAKIVKNSDGCWYWIAHRDSGGYGNFRMNGRLEKAHRASWMIHSGEISKGIEVCHKCDNPPCVNPEHLFLGTPKENMQDCIAKKRFMSPARIAAQTRGSDRYNAKLNEDQVREVHAMFARGISKAKIARHFGVSYSCTNNILLGISWKHLIVKGVLK
jgi:hypothetical protein